jgi:hypothetical protein
VDKLHIEPVEPPSTVDGGVSPEQAAFPHAPDTAAPTAPAPTSESGNLVVGPTADERPRHIGGGVYEMPNGERVKGKKAADAKMARLLKKADEA